MRHLPLLPTLPCLALASLLLSGGCARSFVVASAVPAPRTDAAAEVLETDEYEANRASLKTLAVRFPNDCWKFEKKGADGRAAATLIPACAPWGEALALALAKAGFSVLPLTDVVMLEATQRLAPPAAAKALNVNALLVVDRLEAKTAPADGSRRAKVTILAADPDGTPHDPATLTPEARTAVEELLGDRVRPWGAQAVEAAVEIRVTAILPGSGTPLWRYARKQAAPEGAPAQLRLLLRGRGGRWTPVLPSGLEPAGPAQMDPRVAAYHASMGTNPFNLKEPRVPDAPPAVNLQQLVQELASELATRLGSGT